MTPVLITAPATDAITLADMKAHLRVTGSAEDALISLLVSAATAYLDGWKGVLGRCILSQTWAVKAIGTGCIVLPMPDVVSATVDYGSGAVALVLTVSEVGVSVDVAGAGTVNFICAMSAKQLPAAQMAIKLLAAHWFANREAVGGSEAELPLAVSAITGSLCWSQF